MAKNLRLLSAVVIVGWRGRRKCRGVDSTRAVLSPNRAAIVAELVVMFARLDDCFLLSLSATPPEEEASTKKRDGSEGDAHTDAGGGAR